MIPFFRNLRKALLQKGQTTRYLKYAIGEILLVVIGILLALQINNWNEARKQRDAEKEFIAGIKNDLIRDKESIITVIRLAEEKKIAYDRIQAELYPLYETDRMLLDTLLKRYFVTQRTFYPIMGSYQAAESANELSKFGNKAFTSAVTKLYNTNYARLLDNSEDVDNRWFYVVRKYAEIRRTDHLRDQNREQLNELLNDTFYHMYGLEYYISNLKETLMIMDSVMAYADREWSSGI